MPYIVDETRAKNIKAARIVRAMSQAQLAVSLGYERVDPVRRAEAGPWPCNLSKGYNLLKALHLTDPTMLDQPTDGFRNAMMELVGKPRREQWLAQTLTPAPRRRGWLGRLFGKGE